MDKIPFDFSLGIDLENFRGILLVYDEEERLLGYIATYDGCYVLQTSFEFVTPYDNYGNIILERYSNGYEVYYKYDDNGNFLGSYDNII